MGEDIEPYFQEVLSAMELSLDGGGVRGEGVAALRSRLKQLYREILTATGTGRAPPPDVLTYILTHFGLTSKFQKCFMSKF